MPISEKTLRKWRSDSLKLNQQLSTINHDQILMDPLEPALRESQDRILRLTQELMDHHLMRKVG
jgi:hypothetical protein